MRRLVAAAVLAVLAAPAVAADMPGRTPPAAVAEDGFFSGIPACDNPAVLDRIVERQTYAERETWHDGVVIQAIADVRQRYAGIRFMSAIPHRYCEARALLGPRTSDRLYYVIWQRQGFASIGWGLDFCMPRHDPYRVYDADCRVLR